MTTLTRNGKSLQRPPIRAVSFDCWGTLLTQTHTPVLEQTRLRLMLQVLKNRVQPDELNRWIQQERRTLEHQHYRFWYSDPPAVQLNRILQGCGVQLNPQEWQQLHRAYAATIVEHPPRPIAGALEVLQDISARHPVALICNTSVSSGRAIRETLQHLGVLKCFKVLYFSEEQGRAKPDPAVYRMVAAALGCTQQELLHIGDDPITDAQGAQRAGAHPIWLNACGIRKPELRTLQVRDFRELRQHLRHTDMI